MITLSRDSVPANLCIEVRDNGIGMPSAVLAQAFDMFYRGSSLSKGTGLGLYLTKTAVTSLGGTIKVVSEEGKGTAFTIVIPDKPVTKWAALNPN